MNLSPFFSRSNINKNRFIGILLLLQPFGAFSTEVVNETNSKKPSTIYENEVFIGMLCAIVFLAIAILILAKVAKTAIIVGSKLKKKHSDTAIKSLLLFAILQVSYTGFGQSDSTLVAPASAVITNGSGGYFGMDATTFFVMLFTIAFELFVVWYLYQLAMQHLGYFERKEQAAAAKKAATKLVHQPTFLEKMNNSVAIEKEAGILLDHNYDGIRELDNNLPPWWKYGFYVSIVFAVIYLINFHVLKLGYSQTEEYEHEMKRAQFELAEYRKRAANLVDENNATLLTDQSSLVSGKLLFTTNCAACHGAAGEGGVGPNLTDNYWLHGGDVKDVFKTIKYGYAEKGMKSWEQDLGARQIHEVASFIKSLAGTNPPNAKEPQGELITEKAIANDSVK